MLVSLKEIAKYVDISGLTPEEIASFANIPIEEVKEVESTLLTKIYIT